MPTIRPIQRLLIANRGEIAIRIASAAAELNITTVSVYSQPDLHSKHRSVTDESYEIPHSAAHTSPATSPYLDVAAIIQLARQHRCDALHPGYGFLSENVQLVRQCEQHGITFVGPTSAVIDLFGNKLNAKHLVQQCNVPTIGGSSERIQSLEQLQSTIKQQKLKYPLMLKAVLGGGGKGIRIVHTAAELQSSYERCNSEAQLSFGSSELFVEQYIERGHHIEVQILGDTTGNVIALGERDCTIQQHHQKIIEIAPSPWLTDSVRQKLLKHAVDIGRQCNYTNAGTVEFLVDDSQQHYYFLEVNPRVQVEHTITEQVFNLDIVQSQLLLAQGYTLQQLNLHQPRQPVGVAIQARINCTNAGTITHYSQPVGNGIRVDTALYQNYTVPPTFDSMVSKLIVTAKTYNGALIRLHRALLQYQIVGIATNIPFLLNLISSSDMQQSKVYTTYVSEHLQQLNQPNQQLEAAAKRLTHSQPSTTQSTNIQQPSKHYDGHVINASLSAMVTDVRVQVGDYIQKGDVVAIVNAMKMETAVLSDVSGRVKEVVAKVNSVVQQHQPLVVIDTSASDSERANQRAARTTGHLTAGNPTWQSHIDDIKLRQKLAEQLGGERPVARQRKQGKLTVRERIALLLDNGSWREIGSIVGIAKYDRNDPNKLKSFSPSNFIIGRGTVSGGAKTIAIGADDFTAQAGHSGPGTREKLQYIEGLARQMRIPMVRLLDGSSGGGSVAAALQMGFMYLPPLPAFRDMVPMLSEVPVCAALLGPVVGLGAVRAMASHFTVIVQKIGQLMVAGPPLVKYAFHETIDKNDLGGISVVGHNGAIDNIATDEADAFAQVRRFLSYLPLNVWHLPPRVTPTDDPQRRTEELFSIIPHNRSQGYDIRALIQHVVDRDSWFELGRTYGQSAVAGFARIDGYSVGVLAQDPAFDGGALTALACIKHRRAIELFNTFHVPVLSLVDIPGFLIGLESEKGGTLRAGGALIASMYQATVPWFTVILRRAYGAAAAAYVDRTEPSYRVSWPSGEYGSLPVEGGLQAAFKRQIEESKDPKEAERQLQLQYEAIKNSVRSAEVFSVQEMISPADTRPICVDWIHNAYQVLETMRDKLQPAVGGYKV